MCTSWPNSIRKLRMYLAQAIHFKESLLKTPPIHTKLTQSYEVCKHRHANPFNWTTLINVHGENRILDWWGKKRGIEQDGALKLIQGYYCEIIQGDQFADPRRNEHGKRERDLRFETSIHLLYLKNRVTIISIFSILAFFPFFFFLFLWIAIFVAMPTTLPPVKIVYATPWFGSRKFSMDTMNVSCCNCHLTLSPWKYFIVEDKKFSAKECPIPDGFNIKADESHWCTLTSTTDDMKDAAALIFHGPDTMLSSLPDRRSKH